MASKRMFSSVVVGDDNFRLMSAEAQLLYFTFGMEADDYGIVGSPVGLLRMINVPGDTIKELEDNGFILVVSRRVIIRHWNVNNNLRDDRLTPTNYPEVLDAIEQDKNGVYWLKNTVPAEVSANCGQMTDNCQASDGNPRANDGQVRANDCVEREDKDKEKDISLSLSPRASAADTETEKPLLTEGERAKLVALMGEELLDVYLANMAAYIRDGGKVRNPAAMIEKFWREDAKKKSGKKSGAPPGGQRHDRMWNGGSFDTDEFFAAAVKASYDEVTREESG